MLPVAAVPDHVPLVDFLEDWEETSALLPAPNCDSVQRSKVRLHSEGQKLLRGWVELGLLAGPLSGR